MNRFLYAEGNPWTLVDPSGHMIGCSSTSSDLCNETTAVKYKNTPAGKNAAKKVSANDHDSTSPGPTGTPQSTPGVVTETTGTCSILVCDPSDHAVVLDTDAVTLPGGKTWSFKDNIVAGKSWEDTVYDELLKRFPPPKYIILRSYSLKNAQGDSIRIGGKIQKPDFQVYSQSGRLVGVSEAGAGTFDYLTGAKEAQLFRYRTALDIAGRPDIDVEPYLALRGRPVSGLADGMSAALGILSMVDIVVSIVAEEKQREQLEWLKDNDPDYYQFITSFGTL